MIRIYNPWKRRSPKVWAGIDDATLRALLIAGAGNRRIACALGCSTREVWQRRVDLAHVVRCSATVRAALRDPDTYGAEAADALEWINQFERGNRRPLIDGPVICWRRRLPKDETRLAPESEPGDVPGEWRTVWRRRYLFGAFTITKQTNRPK